VIGQCRLQRVRLMRLLLLTRRDADGVRVSLAQCTVKSTRVSAPVSARTQVQSTLVAADGSWTLMLWTFYILSLLYYTRAMATGGSTRCRLASEMMIKMQMLVTTFVQLTAATNFASPTPRSSGTCAKTLGVLRLYFCYKMFPRLLRDITVLKSNRFSSVSATTVGFLQSTGSYTASVEFICFTLQILRNSDVGVTDVFANLSVTFDKGHNYFSF